LKLQLRESEQRSQSSSSRNISPINGRTLSPKGKGVSLVKNQILNININKDNPPIPQITTIPAPSDNILR